MSLGSSPTPINLRLLPQQVKNVWPPCLSDISDLGKLPEDYCPPPKLDFSIQLFPWFLQCQGCDNVILSATRESIRRHLSSHHGFSSVLLVRRHVKSLLEQWVRMRRDCFEFNATDELLDSSSPRNLTGRWCPVCFKVSNRKKAF